MRRLLIVSDTPALSSGLGRVVRELAPRLQDAAYEVRVAGWFHEPFVATRWPYPVIPVAKDEPATIDPVLRQVQPDVVLAIGDPWNFSHLARARPAAPWRLAGYLNVEAMPLPPTLERTLDGFDVLTTTSAFGARVLGRPGVTAIHHGVSSVFRPAAGPRAIHARSLGPRDLAQTFVVLLNAMNILRKNLPEAIAGYARFARGKPDVLCYANTVMRPDREAAPGHDLMQVCLDHDCEVMFNPQNRGPFDTVPDEALAEIYGLADCLLMTSTSEGFGLPLLEAMACGVVPIAPDGYSATELLADGRGIPIPVAAWFRTDLGFDMAMVARDAVAAALERAYALWHARETAPAWRQLQERGRVFAADRPWDRTADALIAALAAPPPIRVADGGEIEPTLRQLARRAVRRRPDAIGVLKMGGLGDMLQMTRVVVEAAKRYGAPAVVFTNHAGPVFDTLDAVCEVVRFKAERPQDVIVRSVADTFRVFLDVRYISWTFGLGNVTPLALRYRWMYERWAESCTRLAGLGRHTTAVMLESLGLPSGDIRPLFAARQRPEAWPDGAGPVLALATGTGAPLKTWPAPYWAALVRRLAGAYHLVQIGGPDDPPVADVLDCRDAPLPAAAWILEQAQALIAPEGAFVHLAAAVGTKAVVLFGPTDPVLFAYPGHVALTAGACAPCWWAPTWIEQRCAIGEPTCVNLPTPDEVLAGLQTLGIGLSHEDQFQCVLV